MFGWSFAEYMPGFHRTGLEGATVAIQQRRELGPGVTTTGFECTLEVDDAHATAAAVEAAGGRVLMGPSEITGVGEFADPAGNVAGAIAYSI